MELIINTCMNALVLLFIKFTKLQNGHQKNKQKNPLTGNTDTFSNKSVSSIRRTESYDPQNRANYKDEQENTE